MINSWKIPADIYPGGEIESGEIQEHPGWEDLIELRNIETEIKEID